MIGREPNWLLKESCSKYLQEAASKDVVASGALALAMAGGISSPGMLVGQGAMHGDLTMVVRNIGMEIERGTNPDDNRELQTHRDGEFEIHLLLRHA